MDPQVAAVTKVISFVILFSALIVSSAIRYGSRQNKSYFPPNPPDP